MNVKSIFKLIVAALGLVLTALGAVLRGFAWFLDAARSDDEITPGYGRTAAGTTEAVTYNEDGEAVGMTTGAQITSRS